MFVEHSCVGLPILLIFNVLDVNDDKIMLKKDDPEFKLSKDTLKQEKIASPIASRRPRRQVQCRKYSVVVCLYCSVHLLGTKVKYWCLQCVSVDLGV